MGDVREGERGAAAADPIRIKGTYAGGGRPIATADLVTWLLEHGRSIEQIAAFVDELCWRTVATGPPLWRVTLHTATLHPQIQGLGCRWLRDRGVTEEFTIALGAEESSDFLTSPIRDSVLGGEVARFRLAARQGRGYPLLERLRKAGATDYLVLPLFRLLDRHPVTSWATDAPGGFTNDHVARLSALVPALGAVIEARLRRRIARDLLDTYLGHQAGSRVLAGEIRRGRGERVRAVIMASDLRGSTALSDHLPADEMIELLDGYFEHVAEPVQAHGGDVLKFLGDGVLAIFPVAELGETGAAAAALQAAAETLAGLHTLRRAPEGTRIVRRSAPASGCIWAMSSTAMSARPVASTSRSSALRSTLPSGSRARPRSWAARSLPPGRSPALSRRRWSPWAPIGSAASPSPRSCSAFPARTRRPLRTGGKADIPIELRLTFTSSGCTARTGKATLWEWLLLGFGVVGITYATKPATRVPSRALPRRRALCTSWKKQR